MIQQAPERRLALGVGGHQLRPDVAVVVDELRLGVPVADVDEAVFDRGLDPELFERERHSECIPHRDAGRELMKSAICESRTGPAPAPGPAPSEGSRARGPWPVAHPGRRLGRRRWPQSLK